MYFVDLQVCKYHWENPPEMCLHCFKPSTESGKTVTRAQSVMLSPLLMRSACVTSLATSPLCYHLPRMEKKAVCGMTGWRKAGCYWQDIRVQLQGTSCRHPRRSGAHCARSLLRATLPTKCGKHIQSCMRHNFASLAQPHSWSTVSSHPHFLKCDWALLVIPGELCFWPSRLSHPHRRLMFLRLFCIEDSDLNKVKKLDCTISTECQRRGGGEKKQSWAQATILCIHRGCLCAVPLRPYALKAILMSRHPWAWHAGLLFDWEAFRTSSCVSLWSLTLGLFPARRRHSDIVCS